MERLQAEKFEGDSQGALCAPSDFARHNLCSFRKGEKFFALTSTRE